MKNRVKQFLEGRSLSAYQFIKETGISPTAGYELARNPDHLPSVRVLETICDRYRVQPNEFLVMQFGQSDDRPTEPSPQPAAEPQSKAAAKGSTSRRARGSSKSKSTG